MFVFFSFNLSSLTDLYTLSLHDALPISPQDSLGLGRFAICATRNGESSQLGTDQAPFFFGRLLAFLKGERKENEIIDRKSTRLNSSHVSISYAVFCLKKKKKT